MLKGTKHSEATKLQMRASRRRGIANGTITIPDTTGLAGCRTKFKGMPEVEDDWGHWFAGLTDGEGCFTSSKARDDYVKLQFVIGFRADDGVMLREIQRKLGMGALTRRKQKGAMNPSYSLYVSAFAECEALRLFFNKYPLKAKKRRDFEIWSKMVIICYNNVGIRWSEISHLATELSAIKKYKPITRTIKLKNQ